MPQLKIRLLLGIIAVLFVSVLYLLYLNLQKPIQPVVVAPTPTITVDPTANWKTFTGDSIVYSFKYPSTWTSIQCDNGVHLFVKPTQRFGTNCETPPFGVISLTYSEKPIETGFLKSTNYTLEKEQQISALFGQATKQVIKQVKQVNETPGPINFIGITFKGVNGYYYLISTEDLQYENVAEQIFSTFKFTDSKTDLKSQVENWPSYTQSPKNLSWDRCGSDEPSLSSNLKTMMSAYPAFVKKINGVRLAYTSKLDFTAQEVSEFTLCEAGNYYPIYTFDDKILWISACSTGVAPDNPKCEETLTQIEQLYGYKK